MVEMSWLTDLLPILLLCWKGRIKCPTWRSFTLFWTSSPLWVEGEDVLQGFFLKGNGVISTSSSWGQLAWSFQGHCSTSKWAKRGPWKKQRILFLRKANRIPVHEAFSVFYERLNWNVTGPKIVIFLERVCLVQGCSTRNIKVSS